MRIKEPLYWGKKAAGKKTFYLNQLARWDVTGGQEPKLSDFYLIKNPANSHNLMDLIKVSQWYRGEGSAETASDDAILIGIAADKREAEDLAAHIMETCYQRYGLLDWNHICPEEQESPCTLSY